MLEKLGNEFMDDFVRPYAKGFFGALGTITGLVFGLTATVSVLRDFAETQKQQAKQSEDQNSEE